MSTHFDQLIAPLESSISALEAFSQITDIHPRPVLFEQVPTKRKTAILTIKAALSVYDEQYQKFTGITEKLSQLGLALQRRRNRARSCLIPISAIPPEILRIIFEFAIDPLYPDIPTAISHVSSNWRRISLSQSSLWLSIKAPEDRLHAFEPYIARSLDKPLNITIQPPSHTSLYNMICDTEMLARVRHLSLEIDIHNDVLRALEGENLDALESLDIVDISAEHRMDEQVDLTDDFKWVNLPALRCLRLEHIDLERLECFRSVVELTLVGVAFSWDSWKALLQGFPELWDLTLHRVHILEFPPPQIHGLLSLQRLQFIMDDDDDFNYHQNNSFVSFFRFLRAPKLRDLDIRIESWRYDLAKNQVLEDLEFWCPEEDSDRYYTKGIDDRGLNAFHYFICMPQRDNECMLCSSHLTPYR